MEEWREMKTRMIELVEAVDVRNVQYIADELSKQNLRHGRGLFCQAIMESQSKQPDLSHVYASLVATINSGFPEVGLLLVNRAVLAFNEAYDSQDTKRMQKTSTFLAHLVNQSVVYPILALNVLMFLLVKPSSDNIEVAVGFCKQCGEVMMEVVPVKMEGVFGEFRRVLKKGDLKRRVQVKIVKMFAAKRSKFDKYPSIIDGLDVANLEDFVVHEVSLFLDIDPESYLDEFHDDPDSCHANSFSD